MHKKKRTSSRGFVKKKPIPEYNSKKIVDQPKGDVRLNKFIANAGVCSRREADALIAKGEIKVNGKVVEEMGYRVGAEDTVQFKGKVLKREKLVYLLLNKPKGYLTTTSDPQGRKTVMDLIKGACEEKLFPVGRLDRTTTGLLLFTNDGDLAKKLTQPTHKIKKIYQVTLSKPLTKADMEAVVEGVALEDGMAKVEEVACLDPDCTMIGMEVHEGKNRMVRRIFEHLGYGIERLDRSVFGGLNKKDLPRGKWRFLQEKEVLWLK